jgi:transposase
LDRPPSVRAEHTRDRYRRIHALRERGLSIQTIARRLDLNYKAARRYLRAPSPESMLTGGMRTSLLNEFKPYLHDRLAAGARNVIALHAGIGAQGYTGSY